MRMLRDDLSEWALHFIHDYNERNELEYGDINFNHYRAFPYHEDKELNDRFDLWEISDEEYPIDPGPDALHVLLKIITDGHIRATWAFQESPSNNLRSACRGMLYRDASLRPT